MLASQHENQNTITITHALSTWSPGQRGGNNNNEFQLELFEKIIFSSWN